MMNERRMKMYDDNCNYKVPVEGCAVPAPSESMKDVIMELHDMAMKARSIYDDIEVLVARALLHGNKVVINADW